MYPSSFVYLVADHLQRSIRNQRNKRNVVMGGMGGDARRPGSTLTIAAHVVPGAWCPVEGCAKV